MNEELQKVAGMPLTLAWRVKQQVMYLYEIDADAIAAHVPPSLEMLEVRPGRGLVALEQLHYHTDHFRPGTPEFLEMVFTIAVQPDLSVKMPMPRFCMHAVSVISDSVDFCEQEGRLLHTPTVLVPGLKMEYSADGASCFVSDGASPIVAMKNTFGQPLPHEHKVLWGQYYTNEKGLQQGMWRWEGDMYEHQKAGDFGTFHPNSVWKGIDMSRVRACYRQMMAKPNTATPVDVRFYHLGLASERNGDRVGR